MNQDKNNLSCKLQEKSQDILKFCQQTPKIFPEQQNIGSDFMCLFQKPNKKGIFSELIRKKLQTRVSRKNQSQDQVVPQISCGQQLIKKLFYQYSQKFKQRQQQTPFWVTMLDYRSHKCQQRKHDFLKHLSYQTYLILLKGEKLQIDEITSQIVKGYKSHDQSIIQYKNIKKRVYDILNTLNQINFLDKTQMVNKNGKLMKKNRLYSLNRQALLQNCVRYAHAKRSIQQLQARKLYKKKTLDQLKKLQAVLKIRNSKIEQKELKCELKQFDEDLKYFRNECMLISMPTIKTQNGFYVDNQQVQIEYQSNSVTIRSKSINQKNIVFKSDAILSKYTNLIKRRGRKPAFPK